MLVIADLCATASTPTTGTAASSKPSGDVDNDATVELLVRTAVTYAQAGVDVVAPSDMMDGRVGAIRSALDAQGLQRRRDHGVQREVRLGVLRPVSRSGRVDAAASATAAAIRWIRPTRARPCARSRSTSTEGADIVMVKPGLPYLDVLRAARDRFDVPIAVYNVSGEYAMVKAAVANGWLDGERTIDEMLDVIRSRRRRHHHHVSSRRNTRSAMDERAHGHRDARRRRCDALSRQARAADRRRAADSARATATCKAAALPIYVAARGPFAPEIDALIDAPRRRSLVRGAGPLARLRVGLRCRRAPSAASPSRRISRALEAAVLQRLMAAWRSGDEAVVPTHDGRIEPLAALYDRAAVVREEPGAAPRRQRPRCTTLVARVRGPLHLAAGGTFLQRQSSERPRGRSGEHVRLERSIAAFARARTSSRAA